MKLPGSFADAPIRRKLMFVTFLATAVAVMLAMLATLVMQWFQHRDELLESVTAQAAIVAANSTFAVVQDDRARAVQTLGALSAVNSIEFAELVAQSGKRLAFYARPGTAMPRQGFGAPAGGYAFALTHLDVVTPIIFQEQRIGAVHLRASLKSLYLQLLWNLLMIAGASAAAFLIAMLMLAGLLPAITGPLQELVDLMHAVSRDNNYTVRAQLHGKDELGLLAQGFNGMLVQLKARDNALKLQREHLAEDVVRRTADLQNVNSLLENELAERRQLEKELLESREHFLNIAETTSDWIWQIDQHGRYVYASARVRDILGYKPEEVLGKTPFDFMPPDEAARLSGILVNLRASSKAFSFLENVNLHKSGQKVILETSGVPIFGDDGSVQGYFGITRDITGRKQMEEQLRETRDYLESLFNYANAPIIVWDPSFRITMFNHAFERLTGRQAQEFIGKPLDLLFPPERRQEALEKILRTTKTGERWEVVEMAIQHASGAVKTALWNSATIYSADGQQVLATIAQGQDITERKQAEEEIRQLNEALDAKVKKRTQQLLAAQEELVRKEKLAVLGQVAGSVGHELRNPLGVMNNAVYFLQTVLTDADDTVKEYLNIIKNEIAGSERIVSDLLDSVRTKPPHPEIVGVRELLEQTLNKLEVPSAVTVKLEIPAALPPLRADPQQIHQVLRNLISNGIEAMPSGGELEVSARVEEAGGNIAVSVRDHGSGIDAEVLPKLFQPLFTTKARGIGLGLVVVKNLTEANGGTVTVTSETGKGSVFTVMLPAAGETGIQA